MTLVDAGLFASDHMMHKPLLKWEFQYQSNKTKTESHMLTEHILYKNACIFNQIGFISCPISYNSILWQIIHNQQDIRIEVEIRTDRKLVNIPVTLLTWYLILTWSDWSLVCCLSPLITRTILLTWNLKIIIIERLCRIFYRGSFQTNSKLNKWLVCFIFPAFHSNHKSAVWWPEFQSRVIISERKTVWPHFIYSA